MHSIVSVNEAQKVLIETELKGGEWSGWRVYKEHNSSHEKPESCVWLGLGKKVFCLEEVNVCGSVVLFKG